MRVILTRTLQFTPVFAGRAVPEQLPVGTVLEIADACGRQIAMVEDHMDGVDVPVGAIYFMTSDPYMTSFVLPNIPNVRIVLRAQLEGLIADCELRGSFMLEGFVALDEVSQDAPLEPAPATLYGNKFGAFTLVSLRCLSQVPELYEIRLRLVESNKLYVTNTANLVAFAEAFA